MMKIGSICFPFRGINFLMYQLRILAISAGSLMGYEWHRNFINGCTLYHCYFCDVLIEFDKLNI